MYIYWCHFCHHAQAIFQRTSKHVNPQPNRLGSLATSGNLEFRPGPKNGMFFLDPTFRVEWLERSLNIKMCIFCPIICPISLKCGDSKPEFPREKHVGKVGCKFLYIFSGWEFWSGSCLEEKRKNSLYQLEKTPNQGRLQPLTTYASSV